MSVYKGTHPYSNSKASKSNISKKKKKASNENHTSQRNEVTVNAAQPLPHCQLRHYRAEPRSRANFVPAVFSQKRFSSPGRPAAGRRSLRAATPSHTSASTPPWRCLYSVTSALTLRESRKKCPAKSAIYWPPLLPPAPGSVPIRASGVNLPFWCKS